MERLPQNNTFEFTVHFGKGRNGRKQIRVGPAPEMPEHAENRIPRISRLMALAIKMDGMIQRGEVKDYAELAVLGHVTRARITQIMNLLQFAPDIQEEILNFSPTTSCRESLLLRHLHSITRTVDWVEQRRSWGQMKKACSLQP